jgi:hypothetical protein
MSSKATCLEKDKPFSSSIITKVEGMDYVNVIHAFVIVRGRGNVT